MAIKGNRFRLLLWLAMCVLPLWSQEWKVVSEHRQRSFPHSVPAGNYSGIAPLGDGLYAVVDDKAREDGFHVMRVAIDSLSGEILSVAHDRFVGNGQPNRDPEGIMYLRDSERLWISGEADNQIREYTLDAQPTGRTLSLPESYAHLSRLYGLESLAYDAISRTFYTVNESTLPADGAQASSVNGKANLLRIAAIPAEEGSPRELFYQMDAPAAHRTAAQYAMGVSELLVLPDQRLLVLEREAFVPKGKIGAFVACKLYVVDPRESTTSSRPLSKRLLCSWRTKLNLTARGWANYEGMCLGPRLADGSQVIILLSDSQAQYAGVLKDWWKTLVIRKE